ncbi:MAG: hypothetical protein CSA36_06975 [Draconibacterium sp.]|nr:MAG: hypothetical protein CSA36_06975 [Draconibacterium sp.]
MDNTWLFTLPQWIIFVGIVALIYGWAENKKPFRLVGIVSLIVLGIYALYVLLGNMFVAGSFLTPNEVATEKLTEGLPQKTPEQVKLFFAYLCFLIALVAALPALFFELKNRKTARIFIVVAALAALFGFFIIVDSLKTI